MNLVITNIYVGYVEKQITAKPAICPGLLENLQ